MEIVNYFVRIAFAILILCGMNCMLLLWMFVTKMFYYFINLIQNINIEYRNRVDNHVESKNNQVEISSKVVNSFWKHTRIIDMLFMPFWVHTL